jgi:hypothetical protein
MRMQPSDGKAGFELHDSEVVRIEWQGGDCTVVLAAYVHRSHGRFGIDHGSVWSQAAHVRVARAEFEGESPTLPFGLTDGRLIAPEREFTNVIPVPSQFTGPVRLELLGESGESIVIVGQGCALALVGEARYVKDFPG